MEERGDTYKRDICVSGIVDYKVHVDHCFHYGKVFMPRPENICFRVLKNCNTIWGVL